MFAIPLWGFQRPSPDKLLIELAIGGVVFGSILALVAIFAGGGVWVAAGLLLLLVLSLPASTVSEFVFPAGGSGPFAGFEVFTLFLIASSALIVAALLLGTGLNLYTEWQKAGAEAAGAEAAGAEEDRGSKTQLIHTGKIVAVLLLGALLLGKAVHSVYWLMVWDSTTDPLGFLWLVFPLAAAIFSGMLLAVILPARIKRLALWYSLLIPALLIVVSARIQRFDFRQITEARAEQASRAIERYHARYSRYPQDLRQLPLGYALSLSEPVIFFGQDWCYDGGDDYYRLGYIDRDHWSDPRLIGRTYKTGGEMPELQPICEPEFAAIQESYPEYPYSYRMEASE